MDAYQNNFRRVEQKYLLDNRQYRSLVRRLSSHLEPDAYPRSSISNVYYDTPDYWLIRTSLQKPVYKEKLRLRSYRVPDDHTTVFAEIKKKYKGVVYKRRTGLPYREALRWLNGGEKPADSQIVREIDWFLHFYPGLGPAMFVSYERLSFRGKENPSLRLTFDDNVLWRPEQTSLDKGAWGERLLPSGAILMEVKIPGAVPLWLADELDALGAYPCSFSKYGNAYLASLDRRSRPSSGTHTTKGGDVCA